MAALFTPDRADRPFLRRLFYSVALAAFLLLVWRLTHFLILAFGSVLGAILFRAVAERLRKLAPVGERLALAIAIALVLAGFAFIGWLFSAQLGGQLSDLTAQLPRAIDSIERSMLRDPVGAALVHAVQKATGGSRFADVLAGLGFGAGEVLLNFIVVMVGAIFFAAQPRLYLRGGLRLVPQKARANVGRALDKSGQALRLWLVAQVICMATMGLLVAGGLWLSGLRSWAALGLLAGLSEFIPYVGPTLAMVPALALGSAEGGDHLLYAFLTYLVVRLIQTNFITPIVQRRVVRIPPALTLFAILGIGAVFGAYGLFFSAAMLVVGFVLVKQLYIRDVLDEDTTMPGDDRARELPGRRTAS